MLRNKEIKIFLLVLISILIVGTVIISVYNIKAGIIAFVFLLLMLVASFKFTLWRYGELDKLSSYLKRIVAGDYSLDIRDNSEGELSILKNEIYKVTLALSEQAELLKKDKNFLVDSISDISHQLKTPLTSMLVMADLLKRDNLSQDKRREFTDNICSQIARLEWLVSSLLKLSKLDAGAVIFKYEPVNIKELIDKSTEHLLIPMDIKNQTLKIVGDEKTCFMGDFNWAAEAVTNIVKNSIEHTPMNGELSISYFDNPLYTTINISNTGDGIDKKDLPYIFDRFYKGKNASPDSIGIGLAISKSIIQKLNGNIDVISEKGEGTKFIIKFYKELK
jgi:signal transduction histidine kinase